MAETNTTLKEVIEKQRFIASILSGLTVGILGNFYVTLFYQLVLSKWAEPAQQSFLIFVSIPISLFAIYGVYRLYKYQRNVSDKLARLEKKKP